VTELAARPERPDRVDLPERPEPRELPDRVDRQVIRASLARPGRLALEPRARRDRVAPAGRKALLEMTGP
jgi:hypothetical protein